MESFYIITPKSPLYKHYFDHLKNRDKIHSLITKLLKKHGLISERYIALPNTFYIMNTQHNKEVLIFSKNLCSISGDYIVLRKSSPIAQEWKNLLEEHSIIPVKQPELWCYFKDCYGHFSTRLFHVEDTLLGYLNIQGSRPCPEGFIEIVNDEYHKIIENAKKEGVIPA